MRKPICFILAGLILSGCIRREIVRIDMDTTILRADHFQGGVRSYSIKATWAGNAEAEIESIEINDWQSNPTVKHGRMILTKNGTIEVQVEFDGPDWCYEQKLINGRFK